MAKQTLGIRYTTNGTEKRIDNLTYKGMLKLMLFYKRKLNTKTKQWEFVGEDRVHIDQAYFEKMKLQYQL